MESDGEILIVPFFGQGHLSPFLEVWKFLSSRNYKITLIIPSNLSSSVSSLHHHHPLVEIAEITDAPAPPPAPEATAGVGPGPGINPFERQHGQMVQAIEAFLSAKTTRILCAVLDVRMSCCSKELFAKFNIPTAAFFTSGACSAAMEYASWKANAKDMKPGEVRFLPRLPIEMTLTYNDINQRPPMPPHEGGPPGTLRGLTGPPPGWQILGPPQPGNQPPWLNEVDGSIAMLINTCDDLEGPFINYLADKIGIPVWGVGPLLPEAYWNSAGSVIHEREIRPKLQPSCSEDEVIQWLDSKPRGSVIYVSFGSEVGPTPREYGQLADALAESNRPFIWAIQPGAGGNGPTPTLVAGEPGPDAAEPGYYGRGLEGDVGDRGLIIRGWAPQLMILSHPSTGGFLSHCGWNSTVEALGLGVPFLAWPIKGDQFFDAHLVVRYLKVGYMVSIGDPSKMVEKKEIVQGIERLMTDEEVRQRAAELGGKFKSGFPASSEAALDAFIEFVSQKSA